MNQFVPFEYTSIPENWRDRLRVHGFSAREFASRFGINLPHFYNVLNGKSSPTLDYAERIEALMAQMIHEREEKIESFRSSENQTGDSNAVGRDSQQRTDGGLPSESSAPTEG